MSSNPFLSKEVKFKRVLKGLAITIPCTIMILYLGIYYIDLIDSSLRQHYSTVPEVEVLGVEEETDQEADFEEEYAIELEDIKEGYGIDEYIYNWDERIEGYSSQSNYLREPIFYFSGDTAEVSQTWRLRDGYELELYCPPKLLAEVIPGEYYTCTVTYNGILVSDSVRRYISNPDEGKTVDSKVSMVIYSPFSYSTVKEHEFLLVGSYAGGSYDDISAFKLEDGEPIKKQFLYDDKLEDTWSVSNPMSFGLVYSEDENFKLVTHHRNPATGPVNVFRIWSLGEEYFTLDRTIGDIVE
ncbi:TPA: hypothetical protein DEP90_02550 [Patescibacteria group bacterium]|nr:hypothetical protein [Patescibacteria group bacterium]